MPDVTLDVRRHSTSYPWTYEALDRYQREIADGIRKAHAESGRSDAVLLLSELAPVITLGRRTEDSDLLFPKKLLAEKGIEVFPTDRGGLATYHGPGQWVAFVVARLETLTGDPRGVKIAVQGLLEAALEVGRRYDPKAEIRSGCETGVWGARGKFASVGVHVDQGVLLHGLSLNGFQTESSFIGLKPCGLDAPVEYLLGASNVSNDAEFEILGTRLIQALRTRFSVLKF